MGFPTILQTAVGSTPTYVAPHFASTTPGNTLVAFYFYGAGVAPTISDTQGNTYTAVGQQIFSFGSLLAGMFVASGIAGGAVTVNISTIGAAGALIVCEVAGSTGLEASQPIASTSSSASLTCGPITTTTANSLIFFGVGSSPNTILSEANGWTTIYNGTAGSTVYGALFAGTGGAPGSYDDTLTLSHSGPVLANLMALGGSGPPIVGDQPIMMFLL
jgi:hypothetical protein